MKNTLSIIQKKIKKIEEKEKEKKKKFIQQKCDNRQSYTVNSVVLHLTIKYPTYV